MKAMLIADSAAFSSFLTDFLRNYGFDVIHYRSPVKALDNIEEIDPDAMLISAEDYPRHWKPLVQCIRSSRKTEDVIVILFAGNAFSEQDAAVASALSIQALIDASAPPEKKTALLHKIVARYAEPQGGIADIETLKKNVSVVFPNPLTGTIITGAVFFLSEKLLKFQPDAPAAAGIPSGMKIPECRIKLADKTVSAPFIVKQNAKHIVLLPDGADAVGEFADAVGEFERRLDRLF